MATFYLGLDQDNHSKVNDVWQTSNSHYPVLYLSRRYEQSFYMGELKAMKGKCWLKTFGEQALKQIQLMDLINHDKKFPPVERAKDLCKLLFLKKMRECINLKVSLVQSVHC